tara:strand:+ start:519 stop:728 length:210 start_codon:yes stop_codon:yes gene_type:complete
MTKRELLNAIETAPMESEVFVAGELYSGWFFAEVAYTAVFSHGPDGPYPIHRNASDDEIARNQYGIFIK